MTTNTIRRQGGGESSSFGGRRNFIKPSLLVSMDEISGGGKATRPPVVGREMPLDPERSKRYSSQDTQLQEYLKALKKKTDEKRAEVDGYVETDNGEETVPNLLVNRSGGHFLKKELSKDGDRNDNVAKTGTVRPASIPVVVGARASSAALQKAQYFTNKYAKVVSNLSANVELGENLSKTVEMATSHPPAPQVNDRVPTMCEEEEERDEDSSVSSIFNVKSFEDFASNLNDVGESIVSVEHSDGEHSRRAESVVVDDSDLEQQQSDSFKLQLRSLGDLGETEEERDGEDGLLIEKVDASSSPIDSFPSRRTSGEFESDNYSYEEDFEMKVNRSLTSAATAKSVHRSSERRPKEIKVLQIKASHVMAPKRKTFSRGVQTVICDVGLGPDPSCLLYSQLQGSKAPTASFVDPQRVSSYVVSPETLRVLSSYSPSVVALNEMLRHQIGSTRAFVESQRRNYIASITNLRPDYEYTTLEKTKVIILNHRRKKT